MAAPAALDIDVDVCPCSRQLPGMTEIQAWLLCSCKSRLIAGWIVDLLAG